MVNIHPHLGWIYTQEWNCWVLGFIYLVCTIKQFSMMIVIPGPYYRPIEFESPEAGPPLETVFKQCGIFIIRKV